MIDEKLTAKVPQKNVIGISRIEFRDPATVIFEQYNGQTFEIDLRRYSFKTAREAALFVMKIADRSAWDTLILAGFTPVQVKPGRSL